VRELSFLIASSLDTRKFIVPLVLLKTLIKLIWPSHKNYFAYKLSPFDCQANFRHFRPLILRCKLRAFEQAALTTVEGEQIRQN
jgi:hypothetical protein